MTPVDLAIRFENDYLAIAQTFASDNSKFISSFASAWTKVMNSDRYDGPVNNLCYTPDSVTNSTDDSTDDTAPAQASRPEPFRFSVLETVLLFFAGVAVLVACGLLYSRFSGKKADSVLTSSLSETNRKFSPLLSPESVESDA